VQAGLLLLVVLGATVLISSAAGYMIGMKARDTRSSEDVSILRAEVGDLYAKLDTLDVQVRDMQTPAHLKYLTGVNQMRVQARRRA
jgi:hypothetical protein